MPPFTVDDIDLIAGVYIGIGFAEDRLHQLLPFHIHILDDYSLLIGQVHILFKKQFDCDFRFPEPAGRIEARCESERDGLFVDVAIIPCTSQKRMDSCRGVSFKTFSPSVTSFLFSSIMGTRSATVPIATHPRSSFRSSPSACTSL